MSALDMTDLERVAAALRAVRAGVDRALLILEGAPSTADAWATVLASVPPEGLPLSRLRQVMLAEGLDPRGIGGQVRLGRLRRASILPPGHPEALYLRGETP
jgi:hypothetical protein